MDLPAASIAHRRAIHTGFGIEDETVQGLHVLHGARDRDWLLFPE
ncbi:hypothetical protein RUR49_20465 [Pseudoxanthobacter sp. M-2]